MLYKQKPLNFPTDMKVSEAIIEHDWEILLVQRADHCSEWWTWCGPWGKLEHWEDYKHALVREVREETGVDISWEKYEELFTKYFYFKEKYISIRFYKITLSQKPSISLNDEHQDSIWITPQEALRMNLNEDFDIILKEIYQL